MTRSSCPTCPLPRQRPRLTTVFAWAALLAGVVVPAAAAHAQGSSPDPSALRTQLERRFEVLPIRDGVVLRPRSAASPVRSIEIAAGTIAIDGQAVTGAELRGRLAADADLVLQLSYLDDDRRRALFASGTATTPATAPADTPAMPPPPPPPPATVDPPEPPRPPRTPRAGRRGDRVRFGGSLTVDEDETVAGDVVVIGGSADVRGEVTGDTVVVMGSLHLGPNAEVWKDAVVVGGALRREPGSQVHGKVEEVSVGPINIDWRGPRRPLEWWGRGAWGPAFSLVATLVRVGVLALLAALVMLFARDYTDRITARAVAEPLKAGAVGLLAQVLFLPVLIITVVLFAVTIVGIPLLLLVPFALLGLAILALVGFTAVATHVGRLVTERLGWTEYGGIATTVIGVLVVASPVILARLVGIAGGPLWFISAALLVVGFSAEYLAWTIGIGAVALARFSRGFTGGSPVTGSAGPLGPGGPLGPTSSDPLGPPTDQVSPA